MKELFDIVSRQCSESVTNAYSTSFSSATKMLSPTIRQDIYNIYGFVRFADEIVDTFHEYDKSVLFNRFEKDLEFALEEKISLNPILNSFQETVHKYNIERGLIASFMKSMRLGFIQNRVPNRAGIQRIHIRVRRCGWAYVSSCFFEEVIQKNTAYLKILQWHSGLPFKK